MHPVYSASGLMGFQDCVVEKGWDGMGWDGLRPTLLIPYPEIYFYVVLRIAPGYFVKLWLYQSPNLLCKNQGFLANLVKSLLNIKN
jgi:hypothetical protein